MIEPKLMCNRHLVAEHGETHLFAEMLKLKVPMDKFVKANCVELRNDILSILRRHDALVQEMFNRGYRHYSPMSKDLLLSIDLSYLPAHILSACVDVVQSNELITSRCYNCVKRRQEILK